MRITAAHGSGGRDTALLVENLFLKHLGNSLLNKLEDAAVLDAPEKIAVTTDSFVVTPLFFPGGDIGKLSVCGTVNDILVMGATPKYLSCGFILEEGLLLEQLERVVVSIALEAAAAGVLIVAGDTKVAGSGGGLYINTTGIGFMPEVEDVNTAKDIDIDIERGVSAAKEQDLDAGKKRSVGAAKEQYTNAGKEGGVGTEIARVVSAGKRRGVSAANCIPGDKIILSGSLGDHHACIMSARMGIESDIMSDCACLNDVVSALFESGAHIKAMRDVTRGGLATVMNELAAASGCMIRLREENLPVRENVRAFCALLGLDPLYMGNEGKLIAVVNGQDAEKALSKVRRTEHGSEAAIIGEVLPCAPESEKAQVIVRTGLGGHRRLDMLIGEGLPRIC